MNPFAALLELSRTVSMPSETRLLLKSRAGSRLAWKNRQLAARNAARRWMRAAEKELS